MKFAPDEWDTKIGALLHLEGAYDFRQAQHAKQNDN